MALAEAAGSLLEQAMGRLRVSVFVIDEDPREALSAALDAAELARRAGHRGFEIMNLTNGAEVSLFLGEWSDTRAAITELGQRELSLDQRANLSCTEAMLAALTGDPEEASACLERHADRLAASEMLPYVPLT